MNALPDTPPPQDPAELDIRYIVCSYLAVVVAAGVAVFMTVEIDTPAIVVATGFTSFAVIYIVAQAIERFLQPISEIWGKPEEVEEAKQDSDAKRSLLAEAPDDVAAKAAAANAKKKSDYLKLERATYFWAVASVISLLVCGALGLGLIQSVAAFNGGEVPGWFQAMDVVITGLAIGAGTKPLHDLISAIQKTKEKE
jgi:hypothetical protein